MGLPSEFNICNNASQTLRCTIFTHPTHKWLGQAHTWRSKRTWKCDNLGCIKLHSYSMSRSLCMLGRLSFAVDAESYVSFISKKEMGLFRRLSRLRFQAGLTYTKYTRNGALRVIVSLVSCLCAPSGKVGFMFYERSSQYHGTLAENIIRHIGKWLKNGAQGKANQADHKYLCVCVMQYYFCCASVKLLMN